MSIGIFNSIAPRYDMTNHVLSLGMDRGWRRKMLVYLPSGNNLKVLDLATGTADVALALAGDPRVAEVVAIDAAEGMLAIGCEKAGRASLASKIKFLKGDASALDLPDRYFDAVAVSFGLRNFGYLMKGMAEAYRVTKPGGRFIVLEFSSPQGFLVKYVHGFYVKVLVPFIGRLLTGEKEPYECLSSTVRAFPSGERFRLIMAQTGFEDVRRYPLAMGAVTIYVGKRSLHDAL